MLKDIENVHGRHLEHRKIPTGRFVAAPLAIVGTGPAVVLGTGGAGRVGADKASNKL
jgi:hypothetical protein